MENLFSIIRNDNSRDRLSWKRYIHNIIDQKNLQLDESNSGMLCKAKSKKK